MSELINRGGKVAMEPLPKLSVEEVVNPRETTEGELTVSGVNGKRLMELLEVLGQRHVSPFDSSLEDGKPLTSLGHFKRPEEALF